MSFASTRLHSRALPSALRTHLSCDSAKQLQAQNTGGAIQQISGVFSLTNSTFSENVAQQIGGGFASREVRVASRGTSLPYRLLVNGDQSMALFICRGLITLAGCKPAI